MAAGALPVRIVMIKKMVCCPKGTGKGAKAVTRNQEEILREWENFISLFLAPSRDDSLDLIDY
jgi:hypothetical protein